MKFEDLYKSVFAILRVEGSSAKIVGTGFVVNIKPLRIITCNHVVGEGNESNNGAVKYSITKRSDLISDFDLRKIEISFLTVKRIIHKPEFDLAILEVDPSTNIAVANKLTLQNVKALELSFKLDDRALGSEIEWLSTAASGDLTLTPRFFKGNLITNYTTNQHYEYVANGGKIIQQIMNGVKLLEVDKLFIPGVSGSPILNVISNKVIGYVHGFKAWPIETNTQISQKIETIEAGNSKNIDTKSKMIMSASLSLGIDIRTIESYLEVEKFIS